MEWIDEQRAEGELSDASIRHDMNLLSRFFSWAIRAGEKALSTLINGDRGFLIYFEADEDPGFTSRNPAYNAPADALIEYYLDNGQRDEYPAFWAYPIDEVMRALEYFRREEQRPPFIEWRRD